MPHPAPTRRLASLLLALTAGLAAANPALIQPEAPIDIQTHARPAPYTGHQVIQVIVTNQHQLDGALGLAEGVWSERVGIGPIELQVTADSLVGYRALGLNPVVLIDDLQQRADLDWQRIVRADRLEQGRPINNNRGGSPHDEAWFTNFKQYGEINAYISNIATARPDLASIASIGSSIEGRAINSITITAPDAPGNAASDRPAIVFNGCQHAREWISPMTVTYLASRFVDEYDTNAEIQQLLTTARIVIVPVVNPDGYIYSWTDQRFWRKNRRDISGSPEFGVDLNRNWGYEWGGEGASPDPADNIYHGAAPFSEPETTAMVALADQLGDDLVAHIDYHAYSQLILWPFGYATGVVTPEPDRTLFDNLSSDMSDSIFSTSGEFYSPIQSLDLYPAAGTSTDWYYGDREATSFTVELRPSSADPGFDLPPEEIIPTAHENWPAAILFAQRTTQPLAVGGEQPSVIASDTPVPVSITISDGIATLDPASPTLNVRVGTSDAIDSYPMVNAGNGVFTADLPATDCGAVLHYSFSVSTTDGLTIEFPTTGTFDAITESAVEVFADSMETNTGWVVGAPSDNATTGIWERANPEPTAAQPADDASAIGSLCWITDATAGDSIGNFDIDGGATTLTSPSLDASAFTGEAVLSYTRWYSNNAGAAPDEDSMQVLISNNDGASWTTLETVTENAGAWVEKRFTISDTLTPTSQMRVRFVASDLFNGSIVEAGIDDLRLLDIGCPPGGSAADINGDGTLDIFDVFAYLDLFNAGDQLADFTGDGSLDVFDVFAFLDAFNAG